MKKSFIFKSMLMIALVCMPFVLTSCSDDDEEEVMSVRYSMGFDSVNSTNFSEMGTIEAAYKEALGVTSMSFVLTGTVSECDAEVVAACKNAESTLKAHAFEGHYTFVVTNFQTQETVYTYQIN